MINYLTVLVCAVVSMIVGGIWYGPIFGKKWMEICGVTGMSEEQKKKMQMSMIPMYIVQFVLTLFQVFVLAWYISTLSGMSGAIHTAFSIWIAFVVPTLAGTSMWNSDSTKNKWTRFLIQAGYQLVIFIIFGWILSMWM